METHILALAKQLRRRGVETTIVTSFPGSPEIDGIPIDRLDCFRLPLVQLAASPQLVGKLRERFEAGRYEMIHIHSSIVAPLCFAAVPAARSLNLPMVVTLHSVMRTMPFFLWLADRAIGWLDDDLTLTAVSGLIAAQIQDAMPASRIRILPNGFDQDLWNAKPQRQKDRERQIQFVSALRLQPRKRPFALVDAFAKAECQASRDGLGLTLTIAGDGPLRPRLERHIARRNLRGKIRLVGWQTREQLATLYRASALFIMPSIKEAFCIAALEARAAGLPVLAMKRTGISDFIQHGVSGVLADDDDEMAHEMAALAADPERLQKLSLHSGDLTRYDWKALAADHIALYRRVLAP
ncbi:glycosyltransferase family 4 protein [Pseudaminobacter sp. NGMCC 1.201702]|uniref:glycosyltransferase family 4 protein n=1 Tax=Pseudaminobacter sp. NGMCC 1.201702 TaxID=3391825 RepID=UPI0039F0B08F